MSRYSWDRRIARAEQLAKEHPSSAEVLRFYAQIVRFQQSVFDHLKAGASSIEPDFPQLLCLVKRIGPTLLAEKADELLREQRTFADASAMADADDHLQFFSTAMLQPFMEWKVSHAVLDRTGTPGRCPACGEWPQAAVLRGEGEGAKRWLLCSLCSTEWEFRRLLCPNCGEEGQDLLPVFRAEGFDHVRVEACDRCHVYIKSVDLTKNGLAVPCVDELATVPLDLWAVENGYSKLQPNILGL
jgi:FdhE protein